MPHRGAPPHELYESGIGQHGVALPGSPDPYVGSPLRCLIATRRGRFARDCCPAPFHDIKNEIGGADGESRSSRILPSGPQPVAPAICDEADAEPDQAPQQIA